jgi:hypothetical protein
MGEEGGKKEDSKCVMLSTSAAYTYKINFLQKPVNTLSIHVPWDSIISKFY